MLTVIFLMDSGYGYFFEIIGNPTIIDFGSQQENLLYLI